MTACPTLTHPSLRSLVVALCGLLALTVSAAVTDPGFTDSLSSTQQVAMGLAKLSAAQRTTLAARRHAADPQPLLAATGRAERSGSAAGTVPHRQTTHN